MLLLAALALSAPAPADLVIQNASIWSADLKAPASFAAVSKGRFVYVGKPDKAYIGANTRKIDAMGSVVIPGLIDSHLHMLNAGNLLSSLVLREATDKEDFVRRVTAWSKELPEGRWILGGRWSVESWAKPETPSREWVDAVSGDRPLFLVRMDGHSGLANSAALKLAGITKDTPDPAGGVIDKDPATGEPTGILRETAMDLVRRHIPAVTPAEKLTALKRAVVAATKEGITSASDICTVGDLPVYEELAKEKNPGMRLMLYVTAEDWTSAIPRLKSFTGKQGWIEVRGFKAYMDGSLGSRTAYMHEPFHNNEPERKDWRGLPMPIVGNGRFLENAKAAQAAGFQTIAHAIGDEANHVLLEQLQQAYPNLKDARCRSEHTQHLLPADVPRFGQLGVIASMQPYHKADDGRYAENYIGAERSRSSYAYKSLLAGGAIVSFGSDWPVVTVNPFRGIEAAVTAKTLDGKVWQPQESISVAEALRSYTSRAAYAMFMEREIGEIEAGKRADFLLLPVKSADLLAGSVDWSSLRPAGVYVEGRKVSPTS